VADNLSVSKFSQPFLATQVLKPPIDPALNESEVLSASVKCNHSGAPNTNLFFNH